MRAAELASRAVALLGGQVRGSATYSQAVVDVPRESWVPSVTTIRDDTDLACAFFDRLAAVDEGPEGFQVWLHLWSPAHRHGLQVRTGCPRDDPRVPSLSGVFAGAAWHERETCEMFGIVFDDHPDLRPLLLPDGFEGHPLRKDFVLAARVAKQWPGRKDPGEVEEDQRLRRRAQPPGVPGPGAWPR